MGGMPYPVEKGLLPLVIEHWFNEGLERTCSWSRPRRILRRRAGPGRRPRAIRRYAQIAAALRTAQDPAQEKNIEQVTAANSFVYSSMFGSSAFTGSLKKALDGLQELVARDWFGMIEVPGGGPGGTKGWKRRLTTSFPNPASLGHWSGYYGNVELIMCETLQRMLEVSLGVDHQTVAPQGATAEKAFEDKVREKATRVWPVYLFITCPQPWFGASVTWQCHSHRSAVRGQVTVVLQTPGHRHPIAPSPVDRVDDLPVVQAEGNPEIMLPNPYYLHGVEKTMANSGYAGRRINALGTSIDDTDPVTAPVRPGVDQGLWAITHANHDSTIVWSSFSEPGHPNPPHPNWDPVNPDPAEAWDMPPIATYRPTTLRQRADLITTPLFRGHPSPSVLSGYYDVVVVSPSARDGGVPDVPLVPPRQP